MPSNHVERPSSVVDAVLEQSAERGIALIVIDGRQRTSALFGLSQCKVERSAICGRRCERAPRAEDGGGYANGPRSATSTT